MPGTVIMFVFGIVVVEVWHTQMPVWAYVVALLLGRSPVKVIARSR